jgi:hypothetical protein
MTGIDSKEERRRNATSHRKQGNSMEFLGNLRIPWKSEDSVGVSRLFASLSYQQLDCWQPSTPGKQRKGSALLAPGRYAPRAPTGDGGGRAPACLASCCPLRSPACAAPTWSPSPPANPSRPCSRRLRSQPGVVRFGPPGQGAVHGRHGVRDVSAGSNSRCSCQPLPGQL